jgi:8-amino-7-oxononanoate synthase
VGLGYTLLHQEIEMRLADLKGAESCLLFSSGFAANMAVMSALGGGKDAAIFSDELNHASIVDGARLACRDKARFTGLAPANSSLPIRNRELR